MGKVRILPHVNRADVYKPHYERHCALLDQAEKLHALADAQCDRRAELYRLREDIMFENFSRPFFTKKVRQEEFAAAGEEIAVIRVSVKEMLEESQRLIQEAKDINAWIKETFL